MLTAAVVSPNLHVRNCLPFSAPFNLACLHKLESLICSKNVTELELDPQRVGGVLLLPSVGAYLTQCDLL